MSIRLRKALLNPNDTNPPLPEPNLITQCAAVTKTLGLISFGFESHEARAIRRTSSMTDATQRKARAEWMVASKSFASRRLRPIHAKNRSTAQRRGFTAKPT